MLNFILWQALCVDGDAGWQGRVANKSAYSSDKITKVWKFALPYPSVCRKDNRQCGGEFKAMSNGRIGFAKTSCLESPCMKLLQQCCLDDLPQCSTAGW